MSTQQTESPGRPGRYQRSFNGLISSLLVTVLVIGGLLYFMGAFRNSTEIEPEAVDYLETVQSAQQAGLTPVYPSALPKGWIATGVDVTPSAEDPVFMIRMLSDDERFVAVRQERATSSALLTKWVDEETQAGAGYTVPASVAAPVAREWKGYTDKGGDSAYVAKVGENTVLVFGSASKQDLQSIVDALVTTKIRSSSS
ncbi:DUF4245 family protein [Pimelobacter simplex]|uniref:DUF4245 family protein n=1 Tax=Nocardioides simplex TaxID=2045 RepID=UPI0037F512BB